MRKLIAALVLAVALGVFAAGANAGPNAGPNAVIHGSGLSAKPKPHLHTNVFDAGLIEMNRR